jgi:hypothetical protein
VRSFDEVAVLFVCDKIFEQKKFRNIPDGVNDQAINPCSVKSFFLLLFDWLFNFRFNPATIPAIPVFSAIKIPCVLFSCDQIGRKVSSGAIAREE